MRLEQEYKKSGYFWLPEKEDTKIPGILTIVNGGKIELEIINHFNGIFDDEDDFNRIIGCIEGDGLVTLEKCFYTHKNFSSSGISKSKIHVNMVLCGAVWEKDEVLTFNTFSFSLDCLEEWIGITGISINHDHTLETATISFTPPRNRIFSLDNGMTLEIGFGYNLSGGIALKEAKVTQNAYFSINSSELLKLDDFISLAFKISNFMCFALDDVVSIKNVVATSTEIQHSIGNEKHSLPIKIYYPSTMYVEKVPDKHWSNMLFTFATIQDNAQDVFNKWFNAYEYLFPAMNLYFSTKINAQRYIDGKFLALAQGLETYHRRTNSETLMDTAVFTTLVEEVINGCPESHREWLQGRLMHGNEINLRKRLKLIIEPFKEYLGTNNERTRLLKNIVDTRNYLTHYSENLAEVALGGIELWKICQKMEVIFNLHFLKVVGFTDTEIKSVVEHSYPLKQKLDS